ncbi:hypothetical protein IAE23_29280 [Bacillus sp. S35]|uniref:hypothetical protein n=1 Tax=Priestia megaterium TaxID=1404 RepID=UPI0019096877|nr:hypothetical protein [Bacillus sp. S35]
MLNKEMRKNFDRNFNKYKITTTEKACLEMIMSFKEEGIDIQYKELDERLGYDSVFFDRFLGDMKKKNLLSWEVKAVPGENNFCIVWDLKPLYNTLSDGKAYEEERTEYIDEILSEKDEYLNPILNKKS